MTSPLSDDKKIERITQLFDKKSNYFYLMLFGSVAFAVLFSLISVLPYLILQNQIKELENLKVDNSNSSEKELIDSRIEILRNQLNLSGSRELEAEIPSFTTLSVVTRDVIFVFPLILGISQLLYTLVLRDLFNLRAELHKLYTKAQKPDDPPGSYLKIAVPLWIDPIGPIGIRFPIYLLQFLFLFIPYIIASVNTIIIIIPSFTYPGINFISVMVRIWTTDITSALLSFSGFILIGISLTLVLQMTGKYREDFEVLQMTKKYREDFEGGFRS